MSDRITVHGLCVRETETGEADKIITLVTEEQGRMSVSAKGVKSLKSRNMAATQPFCYSLFTLKKYKKYYYIDKTYYFYFFVSVFPFLQSRLCFFSDN